MQVDRVSRQSLKRQRTDEVCRRRCHDDAHLGPGGAQKAHQFGALIGSDPTCNT